MTEFPGEVHPERAQFRLTDDVSMFVESAAAAQALINVLIEARDFLAAADAAGIPAGAEAAA
jgi:hypothetical protein